MRESSQRLNEAICAEISKSKPTAKQAALLRRVAADYYHDFFGVPDAPVMRLVADLQRCHLGQLVDRVKAGEFDATKDEAKEWRESPEGQTAFRLLME